MNNNLSTNTNGKPKFSVVLQSDAYKKLINNTLQDSKRATNFIANISTAVANNPALQSCDPSSIIGGGLLAESLNLSLAQGLGFAYLIPYGNKAQFIISYKGLIQLAIRSGAYKDIGTEVVYEGEYKGRDKETRKPIFEFYEKDEDRLTKKVIGYMAYFETINGFKKVLYMSREEVDAHARKYSKSYLSNSSTNLWKSSFDIMAQKTVMRRLLSRFGIMSVEMERAIIDDMGVVKPNGDVEYVDNKLDDEELVVNDTPIDEEVKKETKPKVDKSTGEVNDLFAQASTKDNEESNVELRALFKKDLKD